MAGLTLLSNSRGVGVFSACQGHVPHVDSGGWGVGVGGGRTLATCGEDGDRHRKEHRVILCGGEQHPGGAELKTNSLQRNSGFNGWVGGGQASRRSQRIVPYPSGLLCLFFAL